MNADEQPTPEQLVEKLRALPASGPEMEQGFDEVIAAAEAGGEAHMTAVAGYMVDLSKDAPPDHSNPVYSADTGRPAFHETNILITCQINVEGKVFTAKEALDPFVLSQRIDLDRDHLEKYIKHWLGYSFGKMANDEAGYRLLRSKTTVVMPTDQHDLDRCRVSAEGDPERRLTAVCWRGQIIRPPRIIDYSFGETAITDQQLGQCPCRCHTAIGAEPRVRHPGTGVFDEGRFGG